MSTSTSIRLSPSPLSGGGLSSLPSASSEETLVAHIDSFQGAYLDGKVSAIVDEWVGAGASAPGLSKRRDDLPCQDSHALVDLGNRSGFMIVCDGAGSSVLSHLGAAFLCQEPLLATLRQVLSHLLASEKPPSGDAWRVFAEMMFTTMSSYLDLRICKTDWLLQDFASTCLLVAFGPSFTLGAFVGDGRGAYRLRGQQNWQALFSPMRGEYANETVFLTSLPWPEAAEKCMQTVIIDQPVDGVALMSDGMESHCFNHNVEGEGGKYHDPNEPHEGAFRNWTTALEGAVADGYDSARLAEEWGYNVRKATDKIRKEMDDKTMVMALLPQEEEASS